MQQISWWLPSALCLHLWVTLASSTTCGGVFKKQRGYISTPGFPHRFPVPIHCKWEIDASSFKNKTILVYLTQYYVTTGVTFTEKSYPSELDSFYEVINANSRIFSPKKNSKWLRAVESYLRIELNLKELEGNHLRFLDDKKNVYYMFGFNITYEIVGANEGPKNSCSPQECSFLGNCYASADLSSYECRCFHGYSGPKCSQGPLCAEEHCQNGGTCRHLSAVSFGCTCPPGFVGSSCEYAASVDCGGLTCPRTQCRIIDEPTNDCRCSNPQLVHSDRARYEAGLKLANIIPKDAIWHMSDSFGEIFSKMLSKYLKNSGVSVIEDMTVFNSTLAGEIILNFFGLSSESGKIKESLNKAVEKGKLYNMTLDTTYQFFRREPSLQLLKLHVSKKPVRLKEEFSISCIAQGSVYMSFTWFKDGAYINESLSHRSLSLHLFNLSQGEYQYTLLIGNADLLDQGVYTCRVTDWGMEQCMSQHIYISSLPEVQLIPMSITVEKGEKVDLRCIPSDKIPLQETLSYTWIKDEHKKDSIEPLLPQVPGKEVWEDLHLNNYDDLNNAGSVLEITGIQKSTVYTCMVQGSGVISKKDIRVEVVANKSASTLCASEGDFGVLWPLTNANMDAYVQCPSGGMGVAVRHCLRTPNATSLWQIPDFSDCAYRDIKAIANNLTRLTLGYQVTNTTQVLNNLLTVLLSRAVMRPGEGAKILEILDLVLKHLNLSNMDAYIMESVSPFYHIIDIILGYEKSLLHDEHVQLIQRIIRKHGLLWAAAFNGNKLKGTEDVSNIFVEAVSFPAPVSNFKFLQNSVPVPWFNGNLEAVVDVSKFEKFVNKSVTAVLTAYRRLTQFLPRRYLYKDSNGTDILYELNSQIIAIDIGVGPFLTGPPPGAVTVSLKFEPLVRELDISRWKWGCAVAESASLRPIWNLSLCSGQKLMGNITKCTCHRTGTFALVLVSRAQKPSVIHQSTIHTPVFIGCVCCLTQSLITLSLLVPHWWRHRTCIVFLKIQCCLSVSGAMGIFIYSVQSSVPKGMYAAILALLEIFLLLPLTAHLSILLIIYTEVMQVPRIQRIKQSVVCITTGAPLLAVLSNLLGHRSTGWPPSTWWLQPGSMTFNVFVASALVTTGLVGFLYINVLRKLRILCLGSSEKNHSVVKRLGLMKRSAMVFVSLIFMESASILYINVQSIPNQYFFGSTCALLGSIILLCYTLKSESPPHLRLLQKLKMDPTTPDDFSSDSGISPLSFFTKQDGEQESEGAAPRRGPGGRIRGRDHQADPDAGEQLLLQENLQKPGASRSGLVDSNTLETYVYSEGSLNIQGNPTPISPSRYKPMSSSRVQEGMGFGEYVEQDVGGPPVKPLPVQSFILDPKASLPTEMITTRVCVELGVINTQQRNEVTGLDENAPALVLCSVDVEPCQSRVISTHQIENDPCQSRVSHITHDQNRVHAHNSCHGAESSGMVVCSLEVDQTRLISTHLDANSGEECRLNQNEAIVICSVDVDHQSRLISKNLSEGNPAEKIGVVSDDYCCGTSGNFVLGVTSSEPERLGYSDPITSTPQNFPEPLPPPKISETNGLSPKNLPTIPEEQKLMEDISEKSPKNKESDTDVMDRISHDLDYLLNRKSKPLVSTVRKRAGNLKTAILEEREDEDMCSGPVEYLAKC